MLRGPERNFVTLYLSGFEVANLCTNEHVNALQIFKGGHRVGETGYERAR